MISIFVYDTKRVPLKIYNATRFNGVIEKGGSTRPWKVHLVEEDGVARPYVVKIFTKKHIEQIQSTGKEIIGNLVASEMGLYVPDMALANFDRNFTEFVLNDEQRDRLNDSDDALKFACRLQEGMPVYSHALHKKYLKSWDFANVFAFDCFVHNLDRGKRVDKPNILVEDDNFLLIDHEQTFPFINFGNGAYYHAIMDKMEANELIYKYQQHVFYPIIKDMRQSDKKHLFDEFELLLRNLNIEKIEKTVDEIHYLNILIGEKDVFIEYLCTLKKNPKMFTETLLSYIL